MDKEKQYQTALAELELTDEILEKSFTLERHFKEFQIIYIKNKWFLLV